MQANWLHYGAEDAEDVQRRAAGDSLAQAVAG